MVKYVNVATDAEEAEAAARRGAPFVISLEKRSDRRAETSAVLDEAGFLEAVWFPAICPEDGSFPIIADRSVSYSRGVYGCRASHEAVLQQALLWKLEHYIVFEDDVQLFCTKSQINSLLSYISRAEWDVLYLTLSGTIASDGCWPDAPVQRAYSGGSTVAFAVHCRAYEALLNVFRTCHVPEVDSLLYTFMRSMRMYVAKPILATQRLGFSDICNAVMDYARDYKRPG